MICIDMPLDIVAMTMDLVMAMDMAMFPRINPAEIQIHFVPTIFQLTHFPC